MATNSGMYRLDCIYSQILYYVYICYFVCTHVYASVLAILYTLAVLHIWVCICGMWADPLGACSHKFRMFCCIIKDKLTNSNYFVMQHNILKLCKAAKGTGHIHNTYPRMQHSKGIHFKLPTGLAASQKDTPHAHPIVCMPHKYVPRIRTTPFHVGYTVEKVYACND